LAGRQVGGLSTPLPTRQPVNPKTMGLLKHVLFWPVTGPIAGIEWSMNQVMKVVEEELTDDTSR
jgi:hypothetical protein